MTRPSASPSSGELLEEPLRQIAANAGHEGAVVVAKVRELKPDEGFNALTEKFENLVEAGVIDPTKVVRSALQNAASIASLLLTTEAIISEIPSAKGGESHGRWHAGRRHVLRIHIVRTRHRLRKGGGASPERAGREAVWL